MCFRPEKAVTQGEFLAMLLETLEAPVEGSAGNTDLAAQAPTWLKPYLAAAMRSGLMTGLTETIDPEAVITGGDAALLLQNALDLAAQTVAQEGEATVTQAALAVMNANGFVLTEDKPLTRADVAKILYQVSCTPAPGKAVFHRQ